MVRGRGAGAMREGILGEPLAWRRIAPCPDSRIAARGERAMNGFQCSLGFLILSPPERVTEPEHDHALATLASFHADSGDQRKPVRIDFLATTRVECHPRMRPHRFEQPLVELGRALMVDVLGEVDDHSVPVVLGFRPRTECPPQAACVHSLVSPFFFAMDTTVPPCAPRRASTESAWARISRSPPPSANGSTPEPPSSTSMRTRSPSSRQATITGPPRGP
jgi:hypothetical protein